MNEQIERSKMKSHELAKILLENPDVELFVQKDPEGNGYMPLRGVDFNVLFTEYWDCYSTEWDADEADCDEDEWENMKKELGGKTAVLFP